MRVRFDRFYTYAELTETLDAWAAEFPGLLRLESIGQSYEGRDIPLVDRDEPRDGAARGEARGLRPRPDPRDGVHGDDRGARTCSTACCTATATDERVTHALDTRTFYVVPRVNPDGAEAGLADGRFRRSSVRPYPREEPRGRAPPRGRGRRRARPDDADARRERVWKPHPEDARLLVARRPDDVEGDFYRVLPGGDDPELGRRHGDDRAPLEGLDLNRNWPADWAPEGEQLGAGPYPTSEPEVRALVQAIVDRPNITTYIGYHTFSRRPPAPVLGPRRRRLPDRRPPRVQAHGRGGDAAHRLPGDLDLPRLQVRPEDGHPGGDVDWVYDFLGAFAWVTEFWSPQRAAGLDGVPLHRLDPRAPARGRPRAAEARATSSARATSTGTRSSTRSSARSSSAAGTSSASGSTRRSRGSRRRSRRTRTSRSSSRSSRRGSRCARSSRRPSATARYRLRLVLENTGWLPDERHPEGARAEGGAADRGRARAAGRRARRDGQGARGGRAARGRVERRAVTWWDVDHSTSERTKVEWVVEAKPGERVGVVARHERAGTARAELVL